MHTPPEDDLLQRLRAVRRQELALTHPAGAGIGLRLEDHRASLTQVHDDVRAVLARIDAAESAMRPVLAAWAEDPARGGAHLLTDAPDAGEVWGPEPTPELEDLAAPRGDDQLPDTLRLPSEPTPS